MLSKKLINRVIKFSCRILPLLAFLGIATLATAGEETYSGDFLSRSTLTGDWGGYRNDLAKKGVTFDLNATQTEQGVVDGGKSSSWEYGGRGDLTIHMDTGKMGLWPGGFLTAEFEGSWGHGVNGATGALMPVNTNQLFPYPGQDRVAIPALNFAQFLSEQFGVLVGKLDVMTADENEFAHGKPYAKGDSQFMNVALNANPTLLLTAPYTPLAVDMIIIPTKDPKAVIINLAVFSSVGTPGTSGFNSLNANKLSFWVEERVRTDFFGLTGHQLIGLIYSNKEFKSIDQRLGLEPGSNSIATEKGSIAFYYNFDQYFYEPVKGSGKGVGIFGRFAATDGNPNLMHYFFSLGIGGKGVMASRPDDRFGIGWYYIDIKSPTFTGPLANREFLRDEQGVEAYYSVALTPWAHLTPDIQYIHGAQKQTLALLPANRREIDDATVLGLRLQLMF